MRLITAENGDDALSHGTLLCVWCRAGHRSCPSAEPVIAHPLLPVFLAAVEFGVTHIVELPALVVVLARSVNIVYRFAASGRAKVTVIRSAVIVVAWAAAKPRRVEPRYRVDLCVVIETVQETALCESLAS
jgi:hypothetical protein